MEIKKICVIREVKQLGIYGISRYVLITGLLLSLKITSVRSYLKISKDIAKCLRE